MGPAWGASGVPNDVEKLMRHIVREYLAPQDAVDIDLDASASDAGESLEQDKQRAEQAEQFRAQRLAEAFHEGLRRAHAAYRAGGSAISLDDRRDEENLQADALVNFLVRARLATSSTRESDEGHYIYMISIDWDALERVAREARANLSSILGPAS